MIQSNFIYVDILSGTETERQYFNIDHIVRVYFKDKHVFIETSDYCSYQTTSTSLDTFMDRFITKNHSNILKG